MYFIKNKQIKTCSSHEYLNTLNLRPRQNGLHCAENILKFILLNKKKNRLKFHWIFFPKGPADNMWSLIEIMAWCIKGNKPSSEILNQWWPNVPIHICITQHGWVKQHVIYKLCLPAVPLAYISFMRLLLNAVPNKQNPAWPCYHKSWYQALRNLNGNHKKHWKIYKK